VAYSFGPEYQEVLLAAIVQDPVLLVEHRDALDPAYFEHYDHQLICRVLLQFYDRHRSRPSRVALLEELRQESVRFQWVDDDRGRVLGLAEALCAKQIGNSDLSAVRERALGFARHQALKSAILQSVDVVNQHAMDPDTDLEPLVPLLYRALSMGQAKPVGVNIMDFLRDMEGLRRMDTISDPRYRVQTGFPTLDKYLDGGLGAGEIGFVIAESNKGKSMLLLNFAGNAVRGGKRVVYFTFELKPYEVGIRFIAKVTGCSIADVKQQSPTYVAKVDQIDRILKGRTFVPIYLSPSAATASALRGSLTQIEMTSGWRPDLIVVDYLDEMRPSSSARGRGGRDEDSMYNTYGDLTAALIDLSVDYKCPVWSASQIKREGYGGEPALEHVGRSMQKVDKAEVIVSINQNQEETEHGKLRLKVIKNRRGGGKNMYVRCRVDFASASIYEVASSTNPDPGATNGQLPPPESRV
jgi:hypothetical protein